MQHSKQNHHKIMNLFNLKMILIQILIVKKVSLETLRLVQIKIQIYNFQKLLTN